MSMTRQNRIVNPSLKMNTIGNATLATSLRRPAGGARRRGSQTHDPATGQASCPSDKRCAASATKWATRHGHVVFRPSGPLQYTRSMKTPFHGLELQWQNANRYGLGRLVNQMTNRRVNEDLHSRRKGSCLPQPPQPARVQSTRRYAGAAQSTLF